MSVFGGFNSGRLRSPFLYIRPGEERDFERIHDSAEAAPYLGN
jgi:hypothetical protein